MHLDAVTHLHSLLPRPLHLPHLPYNPPTTHLFVQSSERARVDTVTAGGGLQVSGGRAVSRTTASHKRDVVSSRSS